MIARLFHFFVHDWDIWGVFFIDGSASRGYQQRKCKICGWRERQPMPCVHDWGAWATFGDVKQEGRVIGFTQARSCQHCKKTELNTQTLFHGFGARPAE